MSSTLTTAPSTGTSEQPWLSSPAFDSALIIAPAFVTSLVVIFFRSSLEGAESLPLWAWVAFVLMVDVAHVYATLYRTYLSSQAREKNGLLLTLIPVLCFVTGCLIYTLKSIYFWRVLAYLAVFHFIRQQYGFVALYRRKDQTKTLLWLDGAAVYMATIYPLVYWHCHMPRNFNWFVEGDFLSGLPALIEPLCLAVYVAVMTAYIAREITTKIRSGYLNIPKNLLIAGTALSWWVGIIATDSDLAFTMTNVISHGIPYMALVWLYHGKTREEGRAPLTLVRNIALSYIPAFLLLLILLAYLEEGLWDGLVWREHLSFFGAFASLPEIRDGFLLSILVPLLSLPQSTHYVLDGFIWRVKEKSNIWSA